MKSKMKKELADMHEEMQHLSAKAEKASEPLKADAKARLLAVRDKWSEVRTKLEEARETTMEELKGGFQLSFDDLRESINKLRLWLSEKIAPTTIQEKHQGGRHA
jgi:hypothetical protein